MDLFGKISSQRSHSPDSDEKYPDYNVFQEMIKSVNISRQKTPTVRYTSNNAGTNQSLSGREYARNFDIYEDQNSNNNYQFQCMKQEKFNERQKAIAEHRVFFEEMNLKENLQSYVENFQNRLDKPLALRDFNYIKERSTRECYNTGHKTLDDPREMREEDLQHILTLKTLTYEDAKRLGEFLFHHKIPLQIKVYIILRLEDECIDNRDVARKAFDKSMMQLLEGLLEKYCCTISVFGRKNVQIEDKARPPRELCLLNPLTKLFSSIACYPNSRFLHAHIISLLINAVTFIASNIDNIQRKIVHVCKGETLLCDTFMMDSTDSSQLLSNLIGLRLDDWICGAYDVVLYDSTNKENKNMNEEIIKIQPNMNCTKLESLQNTFPKCTIESGKKYITIIRTKAPKYILMYVGKEWRDHLQGISDSIEKVAESKAESYFRNGNVVGFYHKDVQFENTFLTKVPFLRGLIVSQQRGNVLLWAMDIGTWVYARREKLVCLKHTPMNSLEPLVSIGCLKGPVCELDEELLISSLAILRHAALRNNEIGKKMFMPGAGENLLLLAEHHSSHIRRYIFDILLVLSKYREGCVFLHEKGFDVFLTGKLEFWAHITRSGLRQFPRIKTEIFIMTKILFAIFSVYRDSHWCGIAQAKRALKILIIGQDQNISFFEEVLQQIEDVEQQDGRKLPSCSNSETESHLRNKECYLQTSSKLLQRNSTENGESDLCHSEYKKSIKETPKIKEESAFVYENVTNVKSDSVTHIMECKDSNDIRPVEMAEVICGLLNNNVDGCIYFGLSNDSTVVGITMKENEIKTFSKDVEIIMTKFIRPPLADANYNVKFRPVLENRKSRLQVKVSVYVVEIQLYPHKRVVYSLHGGTRYYTRKGATTIEHITEKKEKKQSSVKEKEEAADGKNKEDSHTELSIEIESKEVTKDGNEHLVKEENLLQLTEPRSTCTIADESYADSSQTFSEISPSGNLITPVFHFIKKLIPNAANE